MVIDILFALFMLIAVFKGWSRGLVVSLCSLLALILGAAAALKLSTSFALYLQQELDNPSPLWPVVSFVLIFLVVAVLVRLVAGLLDRTLKLAMLGWVNRLAGVVFYLLTYIVLFSIGLWLANQLYLVTPSSKLQSHTYAWVEPIGPMVIGWVGTLIPWFKDIFGQLEHFFGALAPPHR